MNNITRYPLILRVFHWSMALLIIGLIFLGILMERFLTDESYTGDMFWWHKSFGVVALILISLRVWARFSLRKSVPGISATLPKLEQMAAAIGHKLLYLFMIVVPVSGYLMSSTFPKSSGITLFGIPLPDALPKSDFWASIFTGMHTISAYCLAALIVLHIAAVVKHRYFDHHERDIVKRMW